MFFDLDLNPISDDVQAQQLYVQQTQGYFEQPTDQEHAALLNAIDDLDI